MHNIMEYHHHNNNNEEEHNTVSSTETNINTATINNKSNTSEEPKIIKSYESDENALNASSIAKVQEDENNSNQSVSSDFIEIVDHVVNDNSIINHELCKTNDLVETIIVCDETNNESRESANIDNTNKENEEYYNVSEDLTAIDGNSEETVEPLAMHAQTNNNQEQNVLIELSKNGYIVGMKTNEEKTTRKEEASVLHSKVFSSRAIIYKKQNEETEPHMEENSTTIHENTINNNNKMYKENGVCSITIERGDCESDTNEINYYLTLADHLYMEKIKHVAFTR